LAERKFDIKKYLEFKLIRQKFGIFSSLIGQFINLNFSNPCLFESKKPDMKRKLKNILVPVDFNPSSFQAIRFAADLAQQFNGKVFLLNIIETPGLLAEFFASGDALVRIVDETKNKLLKISKSSQKDFQGISFENRVERGKPYEKILEVAGEIDASFIVLGENHQGKEMEQDLGSTVYHVTLRSPVPVITVKGKARTFGDRILVPLDLTLETRRQLFSSIVYGMNFGARISLVSTLIGGIEMEKSRIYKKLENAKKTLEENNVECDIKLFERSEIPPFERVLEYSREIDASMILIMTHKEGYTYDNYIGAFAHHIINHAGVPVLSLTSSATSMNFKQVLKNVVDPIGMLFR
jgi:nucleotide-binding universal stress UspA family protein